MNGEVRYRDGWVDLKTGTVRDFGRMMKSPKTKVHASVRKLSRTVRLLRALLDNRILWNASARFEVAILLRGGLGDAMIAARWLRGVLSAMNETIDLVVDLYYALPQNIVFIFGTFPQLRYIYDDITFEHVREYYDFSFVINHLGYLEMDREVIATLPFRDVVEPWREGIEAFAPFTTRDYHPDLGNDFAGLIRRYGFQRHDILQAQTGQPVPIAPFPFCLPPSDHLGMHPALERPYLTLHDGWDAQLRLGGRRPTKSLPTESWAEIAAALKASFPGFALVQLGGKAGAHVPGVDLDLKGRIDLQAAARVLRAARLHIDTDSGLVHVAASLGVRSVVLFGPTDKDYYGYPANTNLASGACRSCWLSTGNWVDSCVLGDPVPRCMDAFRATAVIEAVRRMLGETGVEAAPGPTAERA